MPVVRTVLMTLFLALAGLPAANAEDAGATRTLQTHAMSGVAFRAKIPTGWRIKYAGVNTLIIASPHVSRDDARYEMAFSTYTVPIRALELHGWTQGGDVSLESVNKYLLDDMVWYRDQKVFADDVTTISGVRFQRREVGPGSRPNAEGVSVAAQAGTMHVYSAITPDRVRLEIRITHLGGGRALEIPRLTYRALAVNVILRTLAIEQTSAMSAERRAALPSLHKTDRVRISSRSSYYLDLDASFLAPAGWHVEEIANQPAGPKGEQGTFALQLAPPEASGLPVAVLIFEGTSIGPQSKGSFLATLDSRVKGVLPEGQLESTEETQLPAFSYLASLSFRRSSSTGATIVRTYAQKRADGKQLILKAYTAGGMTAAAHLILIGDYEGFEAFEASLAVILRTLRITVDSPSVRFP